MEREKPPVISFGDDEDDDLDMGIDAEAALYDEWRLKPHLLGDLLKAVRRDKGLTQPEMAELLGVSVRSYKGYELQDTPNVPATALQRLVEFGGVDAARVLTGYAPKIDYDFVVDEVLDLAVEVAKVYHRKDGHQCGFREGLTSTELRDVVKAVLRERDFQRLYRNDPSHQYTWEDVQDAVMRHSEYFDSVFDCPDE